MKRLFVSAIFLFAGVGVGVSRAQTSAPNLAFGRDNAAPEFLATSAARVTLPVFHSATDPFSQIFPPPTDAVQMFTGPAAGTALAAEPAADPAPSPTPRFLYGGRDDYRWQLAIGFAYVHFQSSAFDANTFGVRTTVTYFLNNWLGVEGGVTAAPIGSTPASFPQQEARIALYGGGPKIAWRQKRWEPWLHALFGGAHERPQTALGSRNSYSIMVGGGGDFRWNPRVSFRGEGDYVLTGFFSQTQNNFQMAGGVVFHF